MTLQDPPGTIRSYLVARNNPWISERLYSELSYGDRFEIADNGFGVDSKTLLYLDNEGKRTAGTAGGDRLATSAQRQTASGRYFNCSYTYGPFVISYPEACSRKSCFGKLSCYDRSMHARALRHPQRPDILDTAVTCPAINDDSCPSATDCANDTLTNPTEARHIGHRTRRTRQRGDTSNRRNKGGEFY